MAYAHYVPQFHIRNFGINDKQTARLDKKKNQPPIEVPIASFCGEVDYFSFDENSLSNLPKHLQWIHKNLRDIDARGLYQRLKPHWQVARMFRENGRKAHGSQQYAQAIAMIQGAMEWK